MRISRSIILLGALCAPLASVCSGQAPASPRGFDVYQIIETRNIFDPDRQPSLTAAGAPPQPIEQPPRKAFDYVVLTGVMVNGGQALAFFSGSRPDYDKVTEVNGEIAGAKVTKVTPEGIEVDRAGKNIRVAVGQTVPFDDSAPGAPPLGTTAVESAPAAVATGAGDSAPATSPLPGNLSEVMRRMMERRQQELQ
jgi:hypothetical protein